MAFDDAKGMQIAFEEAQKGYEEGGIPIGAALVAEDGTVLGRGHNMRFQKGSATLHGETSCLENAGRLNGKVYKNCTMYTTLSPCPMCTGACLLYGIKRVVMGENTNFVGAEEWLKHEGVELVNLDHQGCKDLMKKFIDERPEDWNEDIGEE
ncbi:hypothetical protein DIURU_004437 [Diutina rugosa]|uniref:Cytosine deaminase n=1 Tax=Diutina rugosa TaxID=5481 RepID=A0A642UHH4_DIURU|nr:uncharacterized protein DIURU_004437 [Diutina rugosa]KAA8899056.1 hypothetical protein DIURU_004437 [Diutina rugosa]